jgi:hypothetical protein
LKRTLIFSILFILLAFNAYATVADATYKSVQNCNSSVTAFPFTFGIGATSEIKVTEKITATGVETVYTETTDYTVSCTNNDCSAGGTVNTVGTCSSGRTLTLEMNVPYTQESDYVEGMPTLYETFEDNVDKLTRLTQQLRGYTNRSPMLPSSTSLSSVTLDEPRAGQYLRWNLSGTGIESTSSVSSSGDYTPSGTGATSRTVDAKLSEIITPEDYGAKGDGVTDDSSALTAALLAASGKTLTLGKDVTYLISTPETADRMLTIYPDTTIVGHGVTSKIKVADSVLGVRNVFSVDTDIVATDDQGTIVLKDFYVDLNGDENVRADAGEPTRNNALLRAYYFRHVIVDGVIAENAPGNQIIWVYTPLATETDSSATVKNCRFYRVGNDVTGNYNADHSTSYLQAQYVRQYNNLFIKTTLSGSETAMELHGEYTYCQNNVVINYNRGAHIVSDLDTEMLINVVDGNYFSTRLHALTYWSEDGIYDVFISNNTMTGYGGESFTGVNMETHVDAGYIDNVNIHDNVFKNITYTSEANALYFSANVKNVSVTNNLFDTLNWAAIDSDATDSLNVQGNTFNNCAKAGSGDAIIKVMSACDRVTIQNNNFIQALYYSENTVWIAGTVDHGRMSGNTFHTWYNDWPIYFTGDGLSSTSFLVDIELYMDSPSAPDADVYGTAGSRLKNLTSNKEYVRSTAGFGNTWLYDVREQHLSTTTVSFAADADTTIYTVPAGKYLVITKVIVVAGADAGTTVMSIGQDTAETDWIPNNTLSNLDVAADAVILMPVPNTTPGKIKYYSPATVIQAKVSSHAGGATNTLFLYGILY